MERLFFVAALCKWPLSYSYDLAELEQYAVAIINHSEL